MSAIKIFFSYALFARKDKNLFNALIKHLSALKEQGRVEEWYDSAISAGSNWRQIIDAYISNADIIVLLISSDFLASEHCREVEMKRAFERREIGAARIISVLLRPADWMGLPFDRASWLPSDGKPVSLWQDKDAALAEVARGIRKVVEELASQFSNSLTRIGNLKPPLCNISYRRNPFFTGREETLTLLHHHFSTGQTARIRIQALSGLGGIGKTQLAVEYAYRYQNEYKAVFWIRAASRNLLIADATSLADLLSLPEKDRVDEMHLLAALKLWLQYHERWLLLLDNLEDFTLIDLLVSPQCSGHVLLTTRSQATGALAHAVAIAQMTIDESALFLLRRAKIIDEQASQDEASLIDYTQARYIAQEMDGYPLALDQAGAYIEETQKSLTEYLSLYRKYTLALLKRRGKFSDEYPQSVMVTLSLAFERVAQKHPAALELLYLFAFLHPDAIPDEMIAQGAPELNEPLQTLAADFLELDVAIEILLNFSLVHRHADTTTLSIHRIVQVVLIGMLSLEQQRQWVMHVIRMVNRVFPDGTFPTWYLCQRYLPQAQMCARYITRWQFMLPEAGHLLYRLGNYCSEQGYYTEAETHLMLALTILQQEAGPEHLDTVQILSALGNLAVKQANYQPAEMFYQQSLAICERVLGAGHPETANALSGLATLYRVQANYLLAEPLCLRALAICEQHFGLEHARTATGMNNLAVLYQKQGKYALAESLYQRSIAIREIVLVSKHPDFGESFNNLATLYQDQGKYQQAEILFLRVLSTYEETFGYDHPRVALCLNNLGKVYRAQEKYELAQPLYLRAIAIYEEVLGRNHPDLAQCLNNLALVDTLQGKYQQSVPLYQRALAIYEQAFGEEHYTVAAALNNLGKLYMLWEKYQEAEPFLQRASTICEDLLGAERRYSAMIFSNLAQLYTLQGKYEQARPLHLQALAIAELVLGPEHPDIGPILNTYAFYLEQTNKPEEAAALRQRVRMIKDKSIQ